ncbi:hypothetical protein VCRA2114E365_80182 [Vibrio crassostreae]|nr:hypothetical protein VCRA2116O31_370020 [Vibrio crassostreae]CAK2217389.1 hypothetical protein VCRA2113O359_80024 [Vibrio crassostreae]CAK2218874.1 hypothetical protein VCRA2113O199_80014 [Vibrio crassostreae]CAK2231969.1 hypothetical protein VCRA2115O371_90024 [Vibrio crassostreae]CAK2235165.1 hypothetical protein VCRA2114O369_80181 [Vibrio crassostreae]
MLLVVQPLSGPETFLGKNALVERLTLKQPEHIVLPVLFKASNLMVLWFSTKQ